MKKISLLLILLLVGFNICSCKNEKTNMNYSGSVMLYTTLDLDAINSIKSGFESQYKGVVLDCFYGDIESISEKINMSFKLQIPEADVILINDDEKLQEFINNSYIKSYKSKEDKKIKAMYKNSKNTFYTAFMDNKDKKHSVAIILNALNVENAELFEDYILSKSTQEMLTALGFKTVRDDIK